MVSKKDGLALEQQAGIITKEVSGDEEKTTDVENKENTDPKVTDSTIKAMISFDELPKKDRVDYEMVITPLDPAMMEFLKNWYPVQNLVKKDTDFRPIF